MTRPLAPGTRPQTLRQAKRAYAKSSAKAAKLSAAEIAMAERRAVLQERADRIREREVRRKANLRKKEERRETERERVLKGGRDWGMRGRGVGVGASQMDLGRFLGGKREGEDGARSQHSPCDKRKSDRDLEGLEDREDDGLQHQQEVDKKVVSFDMFDDGDEQEGQEKYESECQLESDRWEKQQCDNTHNSLYEPGAGTVNRLDHDEPEGALNGTQRQGRIVRDLEDELRSKISPSLRSSQKEQGGNTPKRLKLETDPVKRQSMSGYDSAEQVKQAEPRSTLITDKKPQISAPSKRSPLRERCTNSIQRPNPEKREASKGMPPPPPPPPRLFRTMVAIPPFEDDFFPSNTQVEREISPDSSTKHQKITMKPPNPQAKILPVPQPPPEDSHHFLASISTQDLDFSGIFTQVAPSKTTIAPLADPITTPQPQPTLPKHDSITNSFNPQLFKTEPSQHHPHQQNPPSTTPSNDNLTTEQDLLANISAQDLFSSQSTIPNSPPVSPPPKSLPISSTTSSQFPSLIPPPPPRPKISAAAAAGTSTSFDLDDDDDGFTADDLATIAVQVELAMSGSSADTARGDEGGSGRRGESRDLGIGFGYKWQPLHVRYTRAP